MEMQKVPSISRDKISLILKNKEEIIISEKLHLIIAYNESIISFKVIDSNDFPTKEYELLSNIDNLYKINSYFRMFNSLSEIQSCIIKEYQNKRISLKIYENEAKIIITNIILNNSFEINIPKRNNYKNFKEMFGIIKDMKEKIDFLMTENKELKNRLSSIENIIQIQGEQIKQLTENKDLNKTNSIIKEEKTNLLVNDFFSNSDIVKNKEDTELLVSFLPKKPKKTSILFNSKSDGYTIKNFHKKVDNNSPTIIIIKADTNRVFGGYTEHKWNIKNDGHDKDDNAFVFSLDNKQKYDVIDSDHAVVERENYIQFGAPCFVINNNCNKTQNLSVGSSYRTTKFCLSGKRNYKVKDYEVHLIEY